MRRHSILAFVVVLGLAVVLGGSRTQVGAQEASPVPTVVGEIAVEETRFGMAEALPPAPATIDHYRIELPPGASLANPPDPGLGAHFVESGALTLRDFSDNVAVTRAAGQATPGAQAREVVPAGTDAQLTAGDSFMWMPYVAGEVRNDGTEPVVFLVVLLFPQGETTAATPAA